MEKKVYEYKRATATYEGKRYSAKGKTQREADRKLERKIADAKRGLDPDGENVTVKTYAEFWLNTYKIPMVREPGAPKAKGTLSKKSCQMYYDKVNGYLVPAIGNMKLRDVRDYHLQNILNEQKGMSKSHLSKLRMVIKDVFSQAYASRKIPFDPSTKLSLPLYKEGTHRSITQEERLVLTDVARTHRCGLWVLFLLGTGIRPGESAPLLVGDLSFERGKELVSINKSLESGSYAVGDPKTEAGIRKVGIPADLIAPLKKAVKGKKKDDFVFPQTDGKTMMTQTCMTNNWRSFCRQMDLAMGAETTAHGHIYDPKDLTTTGIPLYPDPDDPSKPRNGHKLADDFTLYNLRHTFATDLKNANVPIMSAKYVLGHEDISTTANIYTHMDAGDALVAVKIMNKYKREQNPG